MGRLIENGSISAMKAKAAAASSRTLRGPNTVPIQIAIGQTSICAMVCEVVIQAPSSKPACTAPRMSASPNEDRRVFSVEMKVPSRTAVKPSQGIFVGGGGAVVAGGVPGGGVTTTPGT